jgi:energy-coupling factor transporter transmembrane protein EcfT
LPSSFNLISKGEVILPVFRLPREYNFWIYNIPSIIGFTAEGLKGMVLLTLRVFNSVSLSFLLINITPFNDIIKGLKMFRIPDSLLMIFTLTYLYIIILSNSVLESYLAMKTRIFGRMKNKEVHPLIVGRINHIFKMSRRHFDKTYQAMLSRGYDGEVVLTEREKFSSIDYLVLTTALAVGSFFFLL